MQRSLHVFTVVLWMQLHVGLVGRGVRTPAGRLLLAPTELHQQLRHINININIKIKINININIVIMNGVEKCF